MSTATVGVAVTSVEQVRIIGIALLLSCYQYSLPSFLPFFFFFFFFFFKRERNNTYDLLCSLGDACAL